ncbi:hypothetical protein ACT8ZS_27865 [Paenibacillus sp. M.A.Huq-84]
MWISAIADIISVCHSTEGINCNEMIHMGHPIAKGQFRKKY